MNSQSSRIHWIDIAKGIGILFVCLGHMEELTSPVWKQFGASFHMPLFFILSGILYANKDYREYHFIDFLKKEITKLIIPYILWSFIYCNEINANNVLRIFWGNNKLFGYAGLWFLPVMFVSAIITFCVIKKCKSKGRILIAAVCCFALSWALNLLASVTILARTGYPFGGDIAFTGAGLMCLGYLAKGILEKIASFKSSKAKWIRTISAFLLLMVVFVISRLNYPNVVDSPLGRVVMAAANYGNYILFVMGALIGTLGIMFLCQLINQNRILEYVGKNGMLYMVTNHVAIQGIMWIYGRLFTIETITSTMIGRISITLLTLLLVIVFCTVLSYIINRWFPILSGRK